MKAISEKPADHQRIFVKFGLILALLGTGFAGLLMIVNDGFGAKIGPLEIIAYGFAFALISLGVSAIIFRKSDFFLSRHRIVHKLLAFSEGPLIACICLILTLLGLEIGLHIYARSNPIKRLYWYTMNVNTGDYSSLINHPVYHGFDYANPAFFDESLAPQNHTITNDPENGFIVPQNFQGTYINVINHRRFTVGQPEDYQNSIYLFGGSTIFNIAVPDEHTVASNLQDLLTQNFENQYRVENMGVIGVTTGQQVRRLQTMNLEPGDIIIFYDGFNDILENMDRDISPFGHILLKFRSFSTLINPVFPGMLPPYQIQDPELLKEDYEGNLLAAKIIVEDQNSLFVHYLQPSLYLIKNPSEYEKMLLETINRFSPGWAEGFEMSYPILLDVNESLKNNGMSAYDLTDILSHDYRDYDQEIFLDDIHVNHLGNQRIAVAIFENLLEILPGE